MLGRYVGLFLLGVGECLAQTWTVSHFQIDNHRIAVQESCSALAESSSRTAVIFLHGSGGPGSPAIPYHLAAAELAQTGDCVVIPHYLDVTSGSASDPPPHYAVWINVLEHAVSLLNHKSEGKSFRIFVVGYSLGASIALGAAAENPAEFAGIVCIGGSLPDSYLSSVRKLPPLLIIHGESDHIISVLNAKQTARLCRITNSRCQLVILSGEGHELSPEAERSTSKWIGEFVRGENVSFGAPPPR